MRIAIDYDGTYTADPELWDQFIVSALARGHEIVCVTMRQKSINFASGIPCIMTSGQAKIPYCEANGIKIDIWIDDQPYRLLHDALKE